MKVVILCGGEGTRMKELTDLIPKPMVDIGGKPILWHIMQCYSRFGYNEFVLALGYKGEIIKNYFLNYQSLSKNITVDLKSGDVNILEDYSEDWKITLVDTGENSMTGSRIKQIEKYIDSDSFFLTYGDGLSNIDIKKELDFHNSHQKIATLVGVNPPSRFGELVIEDNKVTQFIEKAKTSGTQGFINGGFYILNKKIFDYLDKDPSCVFELRPLENLVKEHQLQVFKHTGFWQCMDTYREFQLLNSLVEESPWTQNE